jgi:hypothetical protein
VVALEHMRQKLVQAETPDYSLFRSSLLTPLRERSIEAEKRIYKETDIKWGRSYNDSALYEQLAGGHLVYYDPFDSGRFKKMGLNADLAGVAYNWVQPTGEDRDESNVELFYRFPLFPEMDATVSYQGIINPALNPSSDYGSAISLRLRSSW